MDLILNGDSLFITQLMKVQLSAMDVLAHATMKNAAKCDTLYETQDLVNHQNFERTLHYQEMPGSTPG